MFQTRRLGRSTVLSLATYTVAASLAIAVTVSAWHYNQRIARLEEAITTLRSDHSAVTEARQKIYVREFATKLMALLAADSEPFPNVLKRKIVTAMKNLQSQPFDIAGLCVKYHPGNQSAVSPGGNPVVLSSSSGGEKLCEESRQAEFSTDFHFQDGVLVEAVKDDDKCAVCFTAKKLDGRQNVVWLVGIVPRLDHLDPVDPTESDSSAYPHLLAWVHSGTILLSIGIGCFVVGFGRRLKRTANRLSSMSGNLKKLKDTVHDARDLLSRISWDGFHQLDAATAHRLTDVKGHVDRAFDQLAVPKLDASIGAANWLRKNVAGWDGGGESTDFAEIARRIVAEEGTAAQKQVVVEVDDVIAQHISEYDAVTLLRNLLGNAFKHGEPPVTVTVTRRVIGPYQKEPAAELVVVNDGTPYVPAEDEGKGHGLKIIKDLAKKYGGAFDIVAGGNGRGAVARLTLDI